MDIELGAHRIGPCPECHIGGLRPRPVFYCATVGGQFISAPDFPAWVCDVCGRREYDPTRVREVEALVNSRVSRRGSARRKVTSGPAADGPVETFPTRGTR